MSVSVVFGDASAAHAALTVWGRGHPGGLSVFDDNWLNTEVSVHSASGRRWRYHAFLRAGDFARAARDLRALLDGDVAVAKFDPRDPWLAATWARDEPDTVRFSVRARDGGSERGERFEGGLSRADAVVCAEQLSEVAAHYPERRRATP